MKIEYETPGATCKGSASRITITHDECEYVITPDHKGAPGALSVLVYARHFPLLAVVPLSGNSIQLKPIISGG